MSTLLHRFYYNLFCSIFEYIFNVITILSYCVTSSGVFFVKLKLCIIIINCLQVKLCYLNKH